MPKTVSTPLLWAYPTWKSTRLHAFTEEGQPSLCRAYYWGLLAEFEKPDHVNPLWKCKNCARAEARLASSD